MLFRSSLVEGAPKVNDYEKTVMRGVIKMQSIVRRKRAHSAFLRMDENAALPLKDAWAIWLFLAHLAVVVWVGSPVYSEVYSPDSLAAASEDHQVRDFVLALALSLGTSFAFVHVFLLVLERHALRLLHLTLLSVPSMIVAIGLVAVADAAGPDKMGVAEDYGPYLGGGITLTGCALFLGVYLVRSRIEPSAALMSKSAALLLEMPGIVKVAYSSALTATGWFLVWWPFAVYVVQHVVKHLWDDFYQQWGEGAQGQGGYSSGEVEPRPALPTHAVLSAVK